MPRSRFATLRARWAATMLLLSACGGSQSAEVVVPPPAAETVESIAITRVPPRIEVGDTVQLGATVRSNRGRELLDRPVSWTSSDAIVAAISSAGRLTALAPSARITIRAEAGGVATSVDLSIERAAVATVNIPAPLQTILVGGRTLLTAVLRDVRGSVLTNRPISWSSSDPTVVTVSDSGVLTGIRAGGPVLVTAASEGKMAAASVSVLDLPTSLARVDGLSVGGSARVVGSGFLRAAVVLLDTLTVAFQIESDTVIRFQVPTLRRCDVDGRTLTLTVRGNGQALLQTSLNVVPTSLDAGQSVVIRADTLTCLQLPARDEDYVLTVLNPTIPEERTATSPWPPAILDLLTFQTASTGAGLSAVRRDEYTPSSFEESEARFAQEQRSLFAGQRVPYSDNPVPFDPRYSTAGVGDTVRFPVAWRLREKANYCALNRSAVRSDTTLSYPVLLVAQSEFVLVGVDLRMSQANQYMTSAARAYLQRVAEAAAPHILPAARIAFDASYTPMKGAGGRHFVVFTTPQLNDPTRGDWGGLAGDVITEMPQATCALASETHLIFTSANSFPPNGAQSLLASVILHEFGHHADLKYSISEGTTNGNPEQWASVVQEIGMRLALGQPTRARYSDLGPLMPVEPNILATTWGRRAAQRLWDPNAAYSQGALFMTLLREWAGETSLTPRSPTFYQRYLGLKPRWQSFAETITAQAQTLGTTVFDLLDRYVLAVTTDDLVSQTAAEKHGLPQIQSWDSRSYLGQPASIARSLPVRRVLAAGPGGYDVAYFLSGGQRVGASFTIDVTSKVPMRIRLTRLR